MGRRTGWKESETRSGMTDQVSTVGIEAGVLFAENVQVEIGLVLVSVVGMITGEAPRVICQRGVTNLDRKGETVDRLQKLTRATEDILLEETTVRIEDTESRKASRDRDYSKLIRNYESMTPAERVKAKLSLQLSETAAKDKDKGMNDGWERFDFDKHARLDDDVEPDYNVGDRTGAPDDTAFLKNTSQSFLSYASQATREKRTESAHEAAMFGVPATNALDNESASQEDINLSGDSTENKAESHVLSEQVIAMQQDSWQERVRKMKAAKSAAAAAT